MNKRYEISIWEDVYSTTQNRWVEEKIAVIGSDTMTSQSRAREPKLVSNINGTNTFSFNMYYSYIDTETGERVKNPFIPYLINERRIKVYWKKKWYDLLIKNVDEDQVNHVFKYTCKDLYLTELSRTGFNLEFNSKLQNNIGTPSQLVSKVIENTDWQFDSENSDIIYQKLEEAVYGVNTISTFTAKTEPDLNDIIIPSNSNLLIYYSCAPAAKENALKSKLQFCYSADRYWKQDDNDMLVLNGTCCEVDVEWVVNTDENIATATKDGQELFTIYFNDGVSKKYRAERYVNSQRSQYNPIVDRYVDVYKKDGKIIYGYKTTEFDDALSVVNLITNPSGFVNASGWTKEDGDDSGLLFRISPPFTKNTEVSKYTAKSYLKINKNYEYKNSGIQNNRSYIEKGFVSGEVYIFRYKCIGDNQGIPVDPPVYIYPQITPIIENKDGVLYFDEGEHSINGEWTEYRLTCIKSCSYDNLISIQDKPQIVLKTEETCWIEEIQFFKETFGDKLNPDTQEVERVRINPNEMDTQSIANEVYHFFDSKTTATSIDKIEFIDGEGAEPINNNFERYGTIEESQSNRFNILQSIAEAFQCWVRFRIDHDDNGYMLYDDDGAPCKYIQLKSEVGQDTGLTFVYGIDLQSITRKLDSDQISTKTIVSSNSNQFAKNGFCTIARSQQNYPRENVIYNFDYYVQQNLLDKDVLQDDLYNYYNELHDNNVEYISNLETLTQKNNELIKQKAQQTIYSQYLSSAEQEEVAVKNDLIKLAGVNNINDALEYAKSHLNNQKVQSLINDRTQIKNTISDYEGLLNGITTSIEQLTSTIDKLDEIQNNIIKTLTELNTAFSKKYARFIQEGTWSSEDYYNDDLYYLDALQVAYQSSRPQITYSINVLRISDTVDFASKEFQLADIAYIQDTEYFGYKDKFTPYKEKVFLSEVTSNFDSPEKDTFKVQNYLTQFDDLFNRITAATQNLEFSQGKYAKAANIMDSDGTIKASVIQETFNSNSDLVYGAQNESATIDNTGITVTSNESGARIVKVTSGGIFVSNDGGETWKNAVRGDGITADALTAGRINTGEINLYDSDAPAFRWDSAGISAYGQTRRESDGVEWTEVDTSRFVRFDQWGMYGLHWKGEEEFRPTSLQEIYDNADFGLTWEKFFIKSESENGAVEISSTNDILVTTAKRNPDGSIVPGETVKRVVIGRLDAAAQPEYGILINDVDGNAVFRCDSQEATLAGWTIMEDRLKSSTVTAGNQHIEIGSDGSIGCLGGEAFNQVETAYQTITLNNFNAINLQTNKTVDFQKNVVIYVYSSTIGKLTATFEVAGDYSSDYATPPESVIPQPSNKINIGVPKNNLDDDCDNYQVSISSDDIFSWQVDGILLDYYTRKIDPTGDDTPQNHITTYIYGFSFSPILNTRQIFSSISSSSSTRALKRYVPKADNAWVIDKEGNAIFHDIFTDGGTIAGWFIDGQRIYQTWDGTRDIGEDGKNIKVELNSSGTANKGGVDYSIITDAINAAMANIGGVLMSGGLINGYNIAKVMSRANEAYDRSGWALTQIQNLQRDLSNLTANYNNFKTNAFGKHQHFYKTYGGPYVSQTPSWSPTSLSFTTQRIVYN